jgi:hypothetical protein
MRLVGVLILAGALAAIIVPGANATRFADAPCLEAGPGGIRVCPGAVVGASYAIRLEGEGGCGPDPNVPSSGLPYQFRLLAGTLPPGLSLREDGLLGGVPREAGSWTFWVELSDQDPPSAAWCIPKKSEREFSIQVGPPRAVVGRPYSVSLGTTTSEPPTWSLASGQLPPGLALSPDGRVAGTPAIAGAFPIRLAAIESRGQTTFVDLTIPVVPRLVFVTRQLRALAVDHPYRAVVRTSGGVRPVSLQVVSGRLPKGIRLMTDSGLLLGKPRRSGIYAVTLRARDALGDTAKHTFRLTVR